MPLSRIGAFAEYAAVYCGALAKAIPIAKGKGLHVITNGNGQNSERVLALGADRFIDYKKEDYAQSLNDVDGVIDTLGERELPKEFGILRQGGHLV